MCFDNEAVERRKVGSQFIAFPHDKKLAAGSVGQMDRQIDRQADKQADRPTDTQIDRQTARHVGRADTLGSRDSSVVRAPDS